MEETLHNFMKLHSQTHVNLPYILQLHMFLSSCTPTETVPSEDQIAEPVWNEDDENLSDTDSESEWNTGPVTLVY